MFKNVQRRLGTFSNMFKDVQVRLNFLKNVQIRANTLNFLKRVQIRSNAFCNGHTVVIC